MGMLGKIGAEAGGLALIIYRPNEAALYKCLKGIVDCRQGEGVAMAARPQKHLIRCRVVPLAQEDTKNQLPMAGQALPMADQRFL